MNNIQTTMNVALLFLFLATSPQLYGVEQTNSPGLQPRIFEVGIDPFFATRDGYNIYVPVRAYPTAGNWSVGGTYGFGDEDFYDISLDYGQPLYTPWHVFVRWGERFSTKDQKYFGRQYTAGVGYLYYIPIAGFVRVFDWHNLSAAQKDTRLEVGLGIEVLRAIVFKPAK